MGSVTFPTEFGGDGNTYTDDADPTTGLANGGHRVRFVPALAQAVAMANHTTQKAAAAQAAAEQTDDDRQATAADRESIRLDQEALAAQVVAASGSASDAADSATVATNMADSVAQATATYTSVTAALSATADGDYFRVIAAPSAALVEVYRNDGGSATLITTYYTKDGVDQTNEQVTRLNRSFSLKPYAGESLRSDFVNQAYGLGDVTGVSRAVGVNDMFTVERSSPKFVPGPQGTLVEVPPDTIAYHYDPETGEALGALIEGGATNQFSFSDDFSQWNGDDESITDDGPESPIPGIGYKRLTAVDGYAQVYLPVTKEAGKSYVQSIYFKPGSSSTITIRSYQPSAGAEFDATTKSFLGVYGYVDSSYQELPDGSFRIWAVLSPEETVSGGNTGFRLDYDGEPVDAFLVGAQIEEGTAPTSYIPTDGAPVTRGEDDITRNVEAEMNRNEGSVIFRANNVAPSSVSDYGKFFDLSNNGNGSSVYAIRRRSGGISIYLYNKSELQHSFVNKNIEEEFVNVGVSWKNGGKSLVYLNGVKVANGEGMIAPDDFCILKIGKSTTEGSVAAGKVEAQEFSYYPRALSATELEALTS